VKLWQSVTLALASATAVQVAARAVARSTYGSWSFRTALEDSVSLFALVPTALVAVACSRAAIAHGWRAVRLVLVMTLPPLAYFTYQSDDGSRAALAAHKWTASALSGGFAWLASVVLVIASSELALFIARRAFR
jgi:hypothetical protein